MQGGLERRSVELRAASAGGRQLTGKVPYGVAASVGNAFTETLAPGCLRPDPAGVVCLYAHDPAALLGRTPNTLRIAQQPDALAFELDLPDTQLGNDTAELTRRGDLQGCSFGMVVTREEWRGTSRTILEARLYELSIVPMPVYGGSSLALRSAAPERPGLTVARLVLQALGSGR